MGVETHLIVSRWAEKCIAMETRHDTDYVRSLASRVYDDDNMAAGVSSGTFRDGRDDGHALQHEDALEHSQRL